MDPLPPRERDTQELIRRFRAKRARRRRVRLVLLGLSLVVVIGGVLATVALAHNMRAGGSDGDASTTSIAGTPGAVSAGPTSTGAEGVPSTMGHDGMASDMPAGVSPSTSTGEDSTPSQSATTVKTTTVKTTSTTTRPTSTTAKTTGTSQQPATTSAAAPPKVVVIDPGHQAHGNSALEPIGPGSSEKKAKVSSGTAGVSTGTPESELVLAVALKLRDSLKANGVKVIMTRTSQDVDISNVARAQIANDAHADLFVRVHADGSQSSSTTGIHVLYPATIRGWTDDVAGASKKAASIAQRELVSATGAKDRGTDARGDMTGFNWSDVPVILPEIGFMTNPAEDRALATGSYQDKIVEGLTRAVLEFLGLK